MGTRGRRSIEDILSLGYQDVRKMTTKELSKVTRTLADVANKRIKRLLGTDGGEFAPSIASRISHTGASAPTYDALKFSVRGLNQGQLQKTFSELKSFIGYETSTVKGWHQAEAQRKEHTGDLSKKQTSKFWSAFRILRRTHPKEVTGYSSDELAAAIRQAQQRDGRWGAERIAEEAEKIIERDVQAQAEEEYESEWMDFDDDEEGYDW